MPQTLRASPRAVGVGRSPVLETRFKLAALLALTSSLLCAQGAQGSAAPGTSKGRAIVDQAVAAMGGDAFLHMQNRVSTGRVYSFFHDQLSGLDRATIYTEYLASLPPKGLAVRERQLLGKKQDYSFLFLEDQGWDITFRGARSIAEDDWARYKRTIEHDALYILRYRLNEPGMQFEYIGNQVYLTSHVEVVDLIDAENETVRIYFDYNTHLPVHQVFKWLDPATKQHNDEVTEFDKYRDAGGGVMWPFAIERSRNGYKAYQMFAAKVEVNQQLPPKTFELPANAVVLKKSE